MRRLLALLIIGCILLAGCQDSPSPAPVIPTTDPTGTTAGTPSEDPIEPTEPPALFQVGVYDSANDPNDTLTIHQVQESSLTFSVFWFRTNSIDNAIAEIDGSRGSFSWTNPDSQQSATGTLDILPNNVVVMTLTESTLSYIEPGIYTYQLFGSEDEHFANSMNEIILKNNDEMVWRTFSSALSMEGGFFYLYFYEDGTYVALADVILGGDSGYITKYSGTYSTDGKTMYIDGNAYEFSASSTAVSTMSLKASGKYTVDFTGEYTLEADTPYQYYLDLAND